VDSVAFCDDTAVGGGVNLALGEDGADVLVGHLGAGPVTVGGNFTVRTGAKSDNLDLEWLTVGGNLTLNVGAADPGFFQQVLVGTTGSHPVRVQGSFALTSGAGFDDFHLARLSVGGGMTIATGGGSDGITVDDTAVAGATVIDLGDGYDHLQVDNQDQDGAGSLSADTAFGGSVTVRAGAQDDKVELSAAGGTRVRFGGRATFRGGNGTDTLANWIGNAFLATGNSQDFETYTGPALQ
jgi:hypothetical protein